MAAGDEWFLARTSVSEASHNGTPCIEWTGAKDRFGYGLLSASGRNYRAHRWAYERWVAPLPDGLVIDHLCRNTSCVNTKHLEAVTQRVNLLRGLAPAAINARKTHCERGHAFDIDNTYVNPRGWRVCRECANLRRRLRRAVASGRLPVTGLTPTRQGLAALERVTSALSPDGPKPSRAVTATARRWPQQS